MKLWRMLKILLGFVCMFIFWGLWLIHGPYRHEHESITEQTSLATTHAPNCTLLLAGNHDEIKAVSDTLHRQPRKIITDEDMMNVASDCQSLVSNGNYNLEPLSEEEASFPLAYIMAVHKNAEQVERTLRAIYAPQNIYCIHVDTKSNPLFQHAIKLISQCFSNVFLATKPVDVVYGGFTRLLADIHCMEDLLPVDPPWKYVINVCGQELPLKTNREIVQILKTKNGTNDIAGVVPTDPEIRKRFEVVHEYKTIRGVVRPIPSTTPKKEPPGNITILFGSAYNLFSRQFVEYIVKEPFPKLLLNWFRDTYSPDENYWVTLNYYRGTPGFQVNPNWASVSRAVKWRQLAPDSYPHCHGIYQRDICIYGVGDLQWLATRRNIIANKFDLNVDHVAQMCMEEWVSNRKYQEKVVSSKYNNSSKLTRVL